MKPRRGKTVAVASGILGLAVLLGAGIAFQDRIVREWRLWNSIKVSGKVLFLGTIPPKPSPIQMTADPNCGSLSKTPAYPEDLVINANKTLMNVLVFVSSGLEGMTFPVPSEPEILEARGCRYIPHVFGVQVGQPLEILNCDDTVHNVHGLPMRNRPFNKSLPTNGMKISARTTLAEPPFKIKDEVHPRMTAWCGVFDHPYFTVTNDKGEFQIVNLPPGKYTLTAWHEKYGEQKQDIEVPAWGSRTVVFEYKRK